MARFVRFAREEFPWIVAPVLAAALAWGGWKFYVWYTTPESFCGYPIF